MKKPTIITIGFFAGQTLLLILSIILWFITWGLFPWYGDKGGGGLYDIQEDRF